MKKIYDFSSFSKIYEADEEKKDKPYVSLLKQILSNLNTCYMSQIKLAEKPYDSKIMVDLDLLSKSPGVDSYKKILDNIKGAVDTKSLEAKSASEAWNTSAGKFISALEKMYEKLPESKDEINKAIADFTNLQKQSLQKASQENDLKKDEKKMEQKNESYSYDFLNEGIFDTKKSLFRKLSKEVTISLALLKNSESIPGMEDEVKTQQSKIDSIVSKFSGKEIKAMDKKELEKDLALLSTIPVEIAKKSEQLAKEDTANKEAAALFIDALKSLDSAAEKDKVFSEKIKAEKEGSEKSKKEAREAIGFKETIKMDQVKGKKDKVVSEVQKKVISSFKDVIKDSDMFKKFSEGKYAGDGFFGENTAKVIKGLKAGFGMKDDTSDITQEFLDNLMDYKPVSAKNESLSYGRFRSFSDFESLNEGEVKFDVNKFKEAIGEKSKLPSVKELEKTLQEISKTAYDNHKEGIDYILSKDFEPTEEGKKLFKTIFRVGWKTFTEILNDAQRKNTVAMGFQNTLEPTTGLKKGIGKDVVDVYLKKESPKS
jgi:hypothetical protein